MSKKVLIVDDDKDIRALISAAIVFIGCTVTEAKDGREGFELAKNEEFDLVIVDGLLPKMSGHDFCKEIRKYKNMDELPIIFMSGLFKGYKNYKMIIEECKANDFVEKPIDAGKLLIKVKTILKLQKKVSNEQ